MHIVIRPMRTLASNPCSIFSMAVRGRWCRTRIGNIFLIIIAVAMMLFILNYFYGLDSLFWKTRNVNPMLGSVRNHRKHHRSGHRRHGKGGKGDVQVCPRPKLSLEHDVIKGAFHPMSPLRCHKKPLFYMLDGAVHVNRTLLEGQKIDRCIYRAIERVDDNYHMYSKPHTRYAEPFDLKVKHDFFRVQCFVTQLKPGRRGLKEVKDSEAMDGPRGRNHPADLLHMYENQKDTGSKQNRGKPVPNKLDEIQSEGGVIDAANTGSLKSGDKLSKTKLDRSDLRNRDPGVQRPGWDNAGVEDSPPHAAHVKKMPDMSQRGNLDPYQNEAVHKIPSDLSNRQGQPAAKQELKYLNRPPQGDGRQRPGNVGIQAKPGHEKMVLKDIKLDRPYPKNPFKVPNSKELGRGVGVRRDDVSHNVNQGGVPHNVNQGGVPQNVNQGGVPQNVNQGGVPQSGQNVNQGGVPQSEQNVNQGGVPQSGQNVNQGGVPQSEQNVNQGGVPQSGQNVNQGGVPQNVNQGGVPQSGQNVNQGGLPQNVNQGGVPQNVNQGGIPQNVNQGGVPQRGQNVNQGGVPHNVNQGGVPHNVNQGGVPQNVNQGGVPQRGQNVNQGGVPHNVNQGGVPQNVNQGGVPQSGQNVNQGGGANPGVLPQNQQTGATAIHRDNAGQKAASVNTDSKQVGQIDKPKFATGDKNLGGNAVPKDQPKIDGVTAQNNNGQPIDKNQKNGPVDLHPAHGDGIMDSDETYNHEDEPDYDQFFVQVQPKQKVFDRIKELRPKDGAKQMNVLIVILDSLSHMSWQRKLPQTYRYLKNSLGSTILDGYNIVGDGTTANLVALLTGKRLDELPETRRTRYDSTYVDSYPLIWNNYEHKGYVTLYAEDEPTLGTFNLRLNGFEKVPTDHYMRAFWQAIWDSTLNKNSPRFCLGEKPKHHYMLEYAKDFFVKYDNVSKFALVFHGELTHKNNNPGEYIDTDLVKFLATLKSGRYLDNTLLVVMSDHGARYSTVRHTVQGKLEERLPLMSFAFPKWFQKKYPSAMKNLKANTGKLTTPFDIYETLRDVLDVSRLDKKPKYNDQAVSILKPIPANRTCVSAGVEMHWCTCLQFTEVNVKNKEAQKAAEAVVTYINTMTMERRAICNELKLQNLFDAKMIMPNEQFLKYYNSFDDDHRIANFTDKIHLDMTHYQLTLDTGPNNGLYEATVLVNLKDGSYKVTSEISRINPYGDQAHCVTEKYPELRKFCQCKTPPIRTTTKNKVYV